MALKHFLLLALALIPAAARAGCETEAVKARQMIMASGPFQYSGKYVRENGLSEQKRGWYSDVRGEYIDQGNGQSEQKLEGLIEPGQAHHILNRLQTSSKPFVLEEIAIGEQTWLKGDTGWFQPFTNHVLEIVPPHAPLRMPANMQLLDMVFPWQQLPGYIVSAKCLGPIEVEGKNLIGYELQYGKVFLYGSVRSLGEQVFAEPETGLTVRLEQIYPGEHGVITFRYDEAIKIEPPKVEANAPEAPLIQLMGAAPKF
jgi:hypothetical protein